MEIDQLDQYSLDVLDSFGYEYASGYIRQRYTSGTYSTLIFHVSEIRRVEFQTVGVVRTNGERDSGTRVYITLSGEWFVWTTPLPPARDDEVRALAQSLLDLRDKALGFKSGVKYHIPVVRKTLDTPPTVNW